MPTDSKKCKSLTIHKNIKFSIESGTMFRVIIAAPTYITNSQRKEIVIKAFQKYHAAANNFVCLKQNTKQINKNRTKNNQRCSGENAN